MFDRFDDFVLIIMDIFIYVIIFNLIFSTYWKIIFNLIVF